MYKQNKHSKLELYLFLASCHYYSRILLFRTIFRYVFNNHSALTSTTSLFGVPWLGSTTAPSSTARSAEAIRQGLDRILYTVWDACMHTGQPIASSVEETRHQFSACVSAVMLALTTNASHMSSYWDLYGVGSGSNAIGAGNGTGPGVGDGTLGSGGSSSSVNIQYAGLVKLWTLVSLLVRSLDVSALLTSPSFTAPSPPSSTIKTETKKESSVTFPNSVPINEITSVDPGAPASAPPETLHPSFMTTDKRTRRMTTDPIHKNPYATSSVPLYPISQSLITCLLPGSPSRFSSPAIRSWLNAATLDPISRMLMVSRCYKICRFISHLTWRKFLPRNQNLLCDLPCSSLS